MHAPFYLKICKAIKIHPNVCVNGSSLPHSKCRPERCQFLVKMLQPFLSRIITDHEMQNSFGLWDACFSENKFLTFVSIGFDSLNFLRDTHSKIPCEVPFKDIVSEDDIDQFFSKKDWQTVLEKYESLKYQSISESFLKRQVTARASQKKHLIHLAILGGLQCLRGTPLILDFFDSHPSR